MNTRWKIRLLNATIVVVVSLATVLALPVVVLVGLGSVEYYTYLTRSESKAQADAEAVFLEVCAEEQLDPSSFQGPVRTDGSSENRSKRFSFRWSRGPDEEISVGVLYFPYDLPYSMSQTLVEQSWDRRRALLSKD